MDGNGDADEDSGTPQASQEPVKKARTTATSHASPKKSSNAPKAKTSSAQTQSTSRASSSKQSSPVKAGAQVKKPTQSPTKIRKK